MQGIGIIIGLLLFVGFLATSGNQGVFTGVSVGEHDQESFRQTGSESVSAPQKTDHEIEEEIAALYRELDSLEEAVRQARLFEPASPRAGTVRLFRARSDAEEPGEEYLILEGDRDNTHGIHISNWYLESYVTKKRAAIPQGARLLSGLRSRQGSDILLLPGERAYLITGETPLRVSFHENACSGYLQNDRDFYPRLGNFCPLPLDEMRRFSNIPLDDDSCYEYVESLGRCEAIDEGDFEKFDLSRRCEVFVVDALNYDGCVENHQHDPLFDDVGDWRVYLDRRSELWRSEREIIRLLDENGRVIDVVEY